MEVTTTQKSVKGPAQMFTGDVWFDVIAKGNDPSRLRANAVRFAPCACLTPGPGRRWIAEHDPLTAFLRA